MFWHSKIIHFSFVILLSSLPPGKGYSQVVSNYSLSDPAVTDAPSLLTFSSDGKTLMAFNRGGMIHYWNLENKKRISSSVGGYIVYAAAVSQDSTILGLGDIVGISVRGCFPDQMILKIPFENRLPRQVAVSREDSLIVVGDSNGQVTLFDLKSGAQTASFQLNDDDITGLVYCPKRRLVFASTKQKLCSFDPGSRKMIGAFGVDTNHMIGALSLSPDGESIFLGCEVYGGTTEPKELGLAPDFSRFMNLQKIVGGEIQVIDFNMNKTKSKIPIHSEGVNRLVVSPNKQMLACSSTSGEISLIRITDYKKIGGIRQESMPTSMAFSPDGKALATSSRNSSIILWNVSSCK